MAEANSGDFIHKEYPKRFARDAFWAQIKRTVNGQPVSEREINQVVEQITRHMQFSRNSHLLDIGCGNGALAARLFPSVEKYTGVDFSAYLLGIANEYFKPAPHIRYIEADARSFVGDTVPDPTIDKVLIYGCMSYFTRADFLIFWRNLSQRFQNVNTVFIGNIPDVNRAAEFFSGRNITNFAVDDNQTPIGVWWDPQQLLQLGPPAGFSAECLKMPSDFYGHYYRFDVVYRRRS